MAAKIDEIDSRIAGLQRMREELARVVGCACDSLDHCTCGAAYLARRGREVDDADAPARHERRERRQHAAADGARRRGAAVAGRPARGPGPAVARSKLLRERAAFLSACGWGSRRAILSSLERRDRAVRRCAARRSSRRALVRARSLRPASAASTRSRSRTRSAPTPELIVVDSYLGSLPADELASLWPSRRTATAKALEQACRRVGSVPRAGPAGARGAGETRLAGAALPRRRRCARLLEELPAPRDGLSGTERRALQAIEAGASTPIAAFVAAQKLEDAVFLGDAWFFRALTGLGPLLETADGEPLPAPPPLSDGNVFARLPIRLTKDGERVLARRSRSRRAARPSTAGSAARTSRRRTSGAGTPSGAARQLESLARSL